jgi:hypothetical protein
VKAYLELQQVWAKTKAGISTKAIPEQQVADLERCYNIVLPDDFRQYLRLSSPVGDAMDNEMIDWWNFGQIKNIPEEYPHELGAVVTNAGREYLFFADYCIWCWAWAISCANDETRGKVVLVAGRSYDKFVADSFTDFVRKYAGDPKSVMPA